MKNTSPDELSPSIKNTVHSELVNILYYQNKNMLWAEAFAATLILFVIWWHSNQINVFIWYAFMFLIGLFRYRLVSQYITNQKQMSSDAWEKRLIRLLFLTSIGWCYIGVVILPEQNIFNQSIILFLLIGVAAAANPFYSPIKKVYVIFLVPILFVTAIFLLLKGNTFYIFTGSALFAFGMLMLITAVISSQLITRTLILNFKNVELTSNLLEANKTLVKLANEDSLTMLPNRLNFYEQLSTVISKAKTHGDSFALMFLDLDKFKHINDTLGHDIGDELLKTVANRLQTHLKTGDIVARLGGDEFLILANHIVKKEMIKKIADTINATLAVPIEIKSHTIVITTSIGISLYPQDGETPENLIKKADIALYQAKKKGGNTYLFFSEEE